MPLQCNGFDCGIYSYLFSYQFIQYRERVNYNFKFKKNSGESLSITEINNILEDDVSKFRLELRIFILFLSDLNKKGQHIAPAIATPIYIRNASDIVVFGKRNELLFGKIVESRTNHLSTKNVVDITYSCNTKKTICLSDECAWPQPRPRCFVWRILRDSFRCRLKKF